MDEELDTMEDLQEELSHIPLSELKEMQEKLGLKKFNTMKHGLPIKKTEIKTFKRENKNRPTELSARRPVPKQQFAPKPKLSRDPRFDDLSGEFQEHIFKQTYGFLTEVKAKEKMKLKKLIKQTKDEHKKSELKQLYTRLQQKEIAEQKKAKKEQLEKEWRKKELEKVKEGKKAYFLKKSEKKALLETEMKKELEQSGNMQKYLQRKNKKLAAKEKRKSEWTTKDF
ncbi:ribosomal RNA processing protein 36 [Biomphalaria glabrata]|nr:putative ribosomal RNA processing protein 36 [Biomphalaria glabrata]